MVRSRGELRGENVNARHNVKALCGRLAEAVSGALAAAPAGYNWDMTAKELLHERVESLSEDECALWLARIPRTPVPPTQSKDEGLIRQGDGARLHELLLDEDAPTLSDEQWEDFVRSIDEQRKGYRVLFP